MLRQSRKISGINVDVSKITDNVIERDGQLIVNLFAYSFFGNTYDVTEYMRQRKGKVSRHFIYKGIKFPNETRLIKYLMND